jgi:glycosyltransferase involved in cell wall biosynthesis
MPVFSLPSEKGLHFYLIQHYENWDRSDEEVDATWQLPMHKVVISRWLEQIGIELGEATRITYIPNGVDAEEFPLTGVIEDRNRATICMLSHHAAWKGTADGLAALSLVRERYPAAKVTLFGVDPRPSFVPPWAHYVERPSRLELSELYNKSAIFLHPSWSEGWPLPPAEAMLSGCALVSAANRGVQEYAVDGQTALLAPIHDPEALARRICELISDDEVRYQIARNGRLMLRTFTWNRAVNSMESLLQN